MSLKMDSLGAETPPAHRKRLFGAIARTLNAARAAEIFIATMATLINNLFLKSHVHFARRVVEIACAAVNFPAAADVNFSREIGSESRARV
jgi:hypothetical protein